MVIKDDVECVKIPRWNGMQQIMLFCEHARMQCVFFCGEYDEYKIGIAQWTNGF